MAISVMLMKLLEGMGVSVMIFLVTLIFSLPLGLLVSFGRMSKNPVIRTIVKVYIESMSPGQYEAAKILGYSRAQTFFRIILPQVIKRILPAVTNETITLVKDTSLAFSIGVIDMFTVAKALSASQTSLLPLVFAGVFYYIFNFIVAFFMESIEKKLNYYH